MTPIPFLSCSGCRKGESHSVFLLVGIRKGIWPLKLIQNLLFEGSNWQTCVYLENGYDTDVCVMKNWTDYWPVAKAVGR